MRRLVSRRRLRLPSAVVAALVAAIVVAAGCSDADDDAADATDDPTEDTDMDDGDDADDDSEEEAQEPAGGGTVVYHLAGDWTDFDVQRTNIAAQNRISRLVYEGMLAWSPDEDGESEIVGHLAEDWEVSPTSITFTLQEGPTCPDGTPVTPSLVQRSWERMLEVSTNLDLAFGGTQGDEEDEPTGVGPFSVSSDDDAGTVTFEASEPNGDLIYGFLGPYGGLPGGPARVVCPEGLDDPDRLETEMFGTGPYELVEAAPGERAVLELRDDYDWGPNGITSADPGMPDRIEFSVVENETTTANLALEGEIDVIGGGVLSTAEEERLASSGEFQVYDEVSPMTTDYLLFNSRQEVFDDVNLREALMMVVDPKTYDNAVNGGDSGAVVNPTFAVEGVECHDPEAAGLVPTGTPEEARQLLLDNGYSEQDGQIIDPDGEPVRIEFLGSDTTIGAGAEYLHQLWTEIGIDVEIDNVERSVWGGRIISGEFDVTVPGFGFDYPSPGASIGWISGPYPPDGNNLGVPRDDDYENEIRLARQTPPGEESCQHWVNAGRMLLENRWAYPLTARSRQHFVRNGIEFDTWNGQVQMITFRLDEPIRE